MSLQFTPLVMPLFLTTALALAISLLTWRRRGAPGAMALALLMLAAAEWALSNAFEIASIATPDKILWSKFQYLAIASVPPLWLIFALRYSRHDQWLPRDSRILGLLWIIPILTVMIAFTNDWHHWLWTSFTPTSDRPGAPMIYGHGTWFWVTLVYSYLLIVIGSLVVFQSVLRYPQVYKQQAAALLSAMAIPLLGNAIYALGLSPLPGVDLTPLTFTASGILIAWGVFRFQLLDVVPVARDVLVENMSDGVLVLDAQHRIVDTNSTANAIVGQVTLVGQHIETALPIPPELFGRASAAQSQIELILGTHTLDVRLSSLPDRRGQVSGWLILLRDISAGKEAEDRLRQLSRAVEQSPASVVITDLQGSIVYVNRKFTEVTGYSVEEIIGQNSRVLKSGETSPEEYRRLWATITSGGEWHGIFHNRKKNGQMYWEAAVISPIKDANGVTTHYLAVKEDITERRRIEEAERDQRVLAQALGDISSVLNSTLDLDQVLDRILETMGRVVPHDAANIMLVDSATGAVHIARSAGYDLISPELGKQMATLRVSIQDVPNLMHMAETGEPVFVGDIQNSLDWVKLGNERWLGSYAAAPIQVKGQALGFLNLNSATPGFFTQAHAERLRAFANQAAIAIENARLFQETQQRNQRLALVNEISVAINQRIELDDVLQAAVGGLVRVLNVSQVGLALFDEKRQHLIVRAEQVAAGNPPAVGVELPIAGNWSVQRILETKSHLAIGDAQNDPLMANVRDLMIQRRVQSVLLVPLIIRGDVMGTLGFDAIEAPRKFTPEEIELAQTVANLLASRIEQARLFDAERIVRQHAQRYATNLSGLYAVTRSTSRSLALNDVLMQALGSTMVSLEFEAGYIALAETAENGLNAPTRLRHAAQRGMPPAVARQLEQGTSENILGGYVHSRKEMVLIENFDQEQTASIRGLMQDMADLGWRACIGIPLLHQEQSLGVMCLFARRPHHTTSFDPTMLSSIGHQAAAAITNAQLFQTTLNERSRLRALIESSRDGIILVGLDGHIMVINAPVLQMLRLTGQTEDWLDWTVRSMLDTMSTHALAASEKLQAEMDRLEAGSQEANEGEIEVPPRAIHWINLPVRVGTRPVGRLIVLRDMTEERAVEQMREDMTHTMVHDLRNPLGGVSASLELMLQGAVGEITPDQREILSIAHHSATRMMGLVNAILDVSRLESGRMPLGRQNLVAPNLIAEAIEMQTAVANAKNIRLEKQIAADLPLAWADAKLIQRVLQNLVGNAIKFTPTDGKVCVKACIGDRNGEPVILISVSDTGPGIPPEIQSRLFQKFVTGGQEASGSGLGLAFCKLALEAHDQRIWTEDTPGSGATFTFSLSVAD